MTQDEIIEIASQVYGECVWHESALLRLEVFVKLVTAKEREACAKVCDEYSAIGKIEEFDRGWLACAKNIAFVIRARGEA